MLQDHPPVVPLIPDAKALLLAELHEHRLVFEATCQTLGAAFIETLDILETGLRRPHGLRQRFRIRGDLRAANRRPGTCA